jgi:hypothetical protein
MIMFIPQQTFPDCSSQNPHRHHPAEPKDASAREEELPLTRRRYMPVMAHLDGRRQQHRLSLGAFGINSL